MALDDDLAVFRRFPLFRLMEADALRLLAFSAETKILRAGDLVARAPDRLDGGRILTRGALAVFDNADQLGHPRQIVDAPALIGELALICETTCAGSIVARAPATILYVSRALFRRVLAEYPKSAHALRDHLARQLDGFARDLKSLAAAPI